MSWVKNPVTLRMIYDEVKKVNERLNLIEDIIEEVLIKVLPEAELDQEEVKEVKESIKEMKKGNFVTLEELKSA
ncbi:MAG: hypothetical protein ACE5KC_01375 [Candidatus Bathyarchaeia archaeon]